MDAAFPFRVGYDGRTALSPPADHIRDMVEQLLFTSPGERVNRPDFGCGLLQLVFAPNSPELEATVRFTVEAALNRWLGDLIRVEELDVVADDAELRVALQYVVLDTGERRVDVMTRGGAP